MDLLPPTKIAPCKCEHTWQDGHYGLGLRLHNLAPGQKKQKENKYRCTVCADTKDMMSAGERKPKDKKPTKAD